MSIDQRAQDGVPDVVLLSHALVHVGNGSITGNVVEVGSSSAHAVVLLAVHLQSTAPLLLEGGGQRVETRGSSVATNGTARRGCG